MFEYILREIILSVIAFLAGAGVSAGVFAFVLVIGVVPRILRCSRIENIILIENVMICGVVAFHKKDLREALKICKKINEKGYKVFVQAMEIGRAHV